MQPNPDFTLEDALQKVEPGLRTGWFDAHLNNPPGGRVPPTATALFRLEGGGAKRRGVLSAEALAKVDRVAYTANRSRR
jgi:hypothetical protein